jgi:hypothetical protein
VRKILLATAAAAAALSLAQAAEKKAKTPEQTCQAQALASIAREWPNVLRGNFEIILKGNRCLVFLQAPAIFEGKRTAWLIDGKMRFVPTRNQARRVSGQVRKLNHKTRGLSAQTARPPPVRGRSLGHGLGVPERRAQRSIEGIEL